LFGGFKSFEHLLLTPEFARESKQDQNNDVNGETGQNAARTTSIVTSTPGTSSGYTFQGPVGQVINPNKILGPDHGNTLTTKNNLALVFYNEGKYLEA
ncbi:unnamed protein product, partial [Allacma fusca]